MTKDLLILFMLAAMPLSADFVEEDSSMPEPPGMDFEELEKSLEIISPQASSSTAAVVAEEQAVPISITASVMAGMSRINVLLDISAAKALDRKVVENDLRPLLKESGVEINWLIEDPGLEPSGYPLLRLSAEQGEDKWFKPDLYLLNAELRDIVTLEREIPLRTAAGLWQRTEHGYGMRAPIAMRKALVQLVLKFLKEYARANPDKLSLKSIDELVLPKIKEKDPLGP